MVAVSRKREVGVERKRDRNDVPRTRETFRLMLRAGKNVAVCSEGLAAIVHPNVPRV